VIWYTTGISHLKMVRHIYVDYQCTCERNIEVLSRNRRCRWNSSEYYIFWVCVCSLRYPACTAHAPCYHLWPVRLYHIFPRCLINGAIFGGKKCVLTYSTTFVWNASHCKKNSVRYCGKCRGTAVAQWLRYCAKNRKVAGSIPDGVIGILHWHNPSNRTMALGSTQPLTEMITRSIFWG
jgi:hypothetical protein